MKYTNLFIALIVLAGLGSSCKIEKRIHRPGYHVEWHKKPKSVQKPVLEEKLTEKAELTEVQGMEKPSAHYDESLTTGVTGFDASAEVPPSLSPMRSEAEALVRSVFQPRPLACETILLVDGSRISAKILEINDNEIRYKRCDYQDGPTITISVNKVDRVIYPNGVEDLFMGSSGHYRPARGAPRTGGVEALGIVSMSLAIVGIFFAGIILGLAAVILSAISLGKFAREPERTGRGFAIAGMIIGFLAIVGAIMVIATM
ncbi:MAG: DUF4190 domain-containing protein [Cryomorphaceae bacterium]|nr:MAG: DUF4190 domain-containing protein [Cryomorphaceae bacterium]